MRWAWVILTVVVGCVRSDGLVTCAEGSWYGGFAQFRAEHPRPC